MILSRHRLIQPYRALLIGCWLLPLLVLLLMTIGRAVPLWHPRLWLLLVVMALPALHIWQQGIDVHRDGLTLRLTVPRRMPFQRLHSWEVKAYPGGRVLSLHDDDGQIVASMYIAHLTDTPLLLDTLNRCVQLHDYVRKP